MKTYEYIECVNPIHRVGNYCFGNLDTIYIRMTELEIIQSYWCWWSREVFNRRPDNSLKITPEDCILDWVAINWAYEVEDA